MAIKIGDPHFYHETMRKMVVLFGSLFSSLHIVRVDADGGENKRFKVPLEWSSKEKWLRMLTGHPTVNEQQNVQITLPRMGMQMTSVDYDPDRKGNKTIQRFAPIEGDCETILGQFSRAPYNLEFTLNVMTRTTDDALQILENILPWFTPDATITADLIPGLAENVDLPISLISVTNEEVFEGELDERRVLIWSLVFVMRGWIYGRVDNRPLITKAIIPLLSGPICDGTVLNTLTIEPEPEDTP